MVETVNFRLRRQEDLVASMAGYLSGHTSFVNDFSEGSITRSLLEAIAQEMFRQNVSYAQGITQSLRSSVKQAFNQPLRQATKAYGQYVFTRKMLPAPPAMTIGFESTGAVFTGSINGTTLTVTSMSSGKILVGHVLSGSNVISGTQVMSANGTTGGIGSYTVSNSHNNIASTQITAFATQAIPSSFAVSTYATGSIPAGTYYWAISTIYGTTETVTTTPISATLTTSQNVTFTWSPVTNATGYRVYRSTSPYMLNCKYYAVSGGTTATFTDTYATGTNGRWVGTTYVYGVTALNNTNGSVAETLGLALQAVPTNNSAVITWSPTYAADNDSSPTGYRIYHAFHDFSMDSPNPITSTVTSSATGLNYGATFTGSISGTTLTVTSGSISSGTIAIGQVVSGTGVQTNTIITAGSGLSWTVSVNQTVNSGTSFTSNMTYYYRVCALTASAEGALSDVVYQVPTPSYANITLSWTPVSGAVGYRVFRSVFSDFSLCSCYDLTDTTLVDTGSIFPSSVVPLPTTRLLGTVSSATINGANTVWQLNDPGIIGTVATWPTTASAFSAQGAITIGAGSQVGVKGTSKIYVVPSIVTMPATSSSVITTVESLAYGTIGNTPANTIQQILSTIYGISGGTNPQAFTQGADIETEEEWKVRFGQSLKDLARGTNYSLAAGAQTAKIFDANGFVTEYVAKSLVVETSNQVVTIYIHNGSFSSASSALVTQTQKIIDGYVDSQGVKQPGYKPAGIPVTVTASVLRPQNITVEVTTSPGYSLNLVQTSIRSSIEQYFKDLDISDGFSVPSITSVTATAGTGSNSYQYKIVAIDSAGNKSLPSDSFTITNAGNTISNQIIWNVVSLGPTISAYDLLRWDGAQWGTISIPVTGTIPAASPYLSGSTMTFIDTSASVSSYVFTPPSINYFQKSLLIQTIMRTPGLVSVKVTVTDSTGADQNVIVPSAGTMLTLGTLTIK